MITIRPEQSADREAIHRVNQLAFGRDGEADLVDALRQNDKLILSLVAEDAGRIIGHIAFSVVTVAMNDGDFEALGLGPLAVLPDKQRCGVGSQLVEAGLDACRTSRHEIVFLLGNPAYYSRFGFVPTQPLGLRWEQDVPAEYFMVTELRAGALCSRGGVVRFQAEFDNV